MSTEGVYGSLDGTSTVLNFAYELETSAAGEMMIEIEVLPVLEQAIVDSILSETFSDDCGPERRNLRVDRRLSVAGVSKNPPDMILTNGT